MTHDGVCFVLVWPPVKEACGVKRISFQGKTRLMEAPRAEPFLPDYIVQRFPDIDDVHEDSQDEYPKREPHHRRQNHAYRHYGYSYAPPFMRLEKQQVDVKG